jgi:phosphatidylinositol alpha-1,6-mannosyltransferase
MNILFLYINAFSVKGGIQRYNINLMQALLENSKSDSDQKISVISLQDISSDIPSDIQEGIRFQSAQNNRIRFIIQVLKAAVKADIIIFGHLNLAFPLIGILSFWKKKRLILIAHGIEVWNIRSILKSWCLKQFDQVLTVSNFTRGKIVSQGGIHKEVVGILHNTLPNAIVTTTKIIEIPKLKEQYGFTTDDFILLTVCRMSLGDRDKGYDKVITCMSEIVSMCPHVKYLLVGKADIAEQKYLQTLINEKGLTQQVIFKGPVNDEQINDLYQIADCFIMPSKKEGFGIVFIEALSRGIPCIGGNKDGTVDALLNGEAGILIDPDNRAEIINAVRSVVFKTCPEQILDKRYLIKSVQENFSFTTYKTKLNKILLEK